MTKKSDKADGGDGHLEGADEHDTQKMEISDTELDLVMNRALLFPRCVATVFPAIFSS